MYIHPNCIYKPNVYTKMYRQMRINVMTRDKVFTMRTDPVFRKNLEWLANELGLPKSQSVEIAVNLFPELVKMYSKLEKAIQDAKANL